MTGPWPCRCGCYRAGAQEIAEATYADNIDPASRGRYRRWGTVRRAAFEGVTVVRWADDDRRFIPLREVAAELGIELDDEPHIIRGAE